LLTDDTGTVVWREAHAAFGKAAVDPDPDGDLAEVTFNVRFPGQFFDAESGLHYNRFRTYDPANGEIPRS
jgi:RHS repeat-associated protein